MKKLLIIFTSLTIIGGVVSITAIQDNKTQESIKHKIKKKEKPKKEDIDCNISQPNDFYVSLKSQKIYKK